MMNWVKLINSSAKIPVKDKSSKIVTGVASPLSDYGYKAVKVMAESSTDKEGGEMCREVEESVMRDVGLEIAERPPVEESRRH